MGLIDDTKDMSERNIRLFQHRVYDIFGLTSDLESLKLHLVDHGGYLAKPFTNAQMEEIAPALGRDVMEGLYKLGGAMPEIATEIWAEATLANDA